jgi:hypothetical protein
MHIRSRTTVGVGVGISLVVVGGESTIRRLEEDAEDDAELLGFSILRWIRVGP